MATFNVLVTGANKGIGLAICKKILNENANSFVYLCSRSAINGQAAVDEQLSQHKTRVKVVQLDVSDSNSINNAAELLKESNVILDAIINNAGVGSFKTPEDIKTFEDIINTNTMGAHNTTIAFLPLLNQQSGRIVNLGSGAGPMFVQKCSSNMRKFFSHNNYSSSISWEDVLLLINKVKNTYKQKNLQQQSEELVSLGLPDISDGKTSFVYGFSKALLHLDTVILAGKHPNLKINVCTPGFIETDMTSAFVAGTNKTAKEMGMKTVEEGAVVPVNLAMNANITYSGVYLGSDGERSPLHKYRTPLSPPYDPLTDNE